MTRRYTYRVFTARGHGEAGWRRLTIESAPCPWVARERALTALQRAGFEVHAISEVSS